MKIRHYSKETLKIENNVENHNRFETKSVKHGKGGNFETKLKKKYSSKAKV